MAARVRRDLTDDAEQLAQLPELLGQAQLALGDRRLVLVELLLVASALLLLRGQRRSRKARISCRGKRAGRLVTRVRWVSVLKCASTTSAGVNVEWRRM